MNDEVLTDENGEENKVDMFDQPEGVDWLVAHIANMLDFGVELDVTLLVNGIMVTGTAISGRTYFTLLSAQVATANATGTDGWREMISSGLEQMSGLYPSEENASFGKRQKFLHLKNARHLPGGATFVPDTGTLWRGKLSSVDAIVLGSLNQ